MNKLPGECYPDFKKLIKQGIEDNVIVLDCDDSGHNVTRRLIF